MITIFLLIVVAILILAASQIVVNRISEARHEGYLQGLEDAEPYMPEVQPQVDSNGLRVFNNLQEVMDYLDSFNRVVH